MIFLFQQDLREKNWAAMEALASSEKACEAKVLSSAKAKVIIPVNVLCTTYKALELHCHNQFYKPVNFEDLIYLF